MKKLKNMIFIIIAGVGTFIFIAYINKQTEIINNNLNYIDNKMQVIYFCILSILLFLVAINALKGFYQLYIKHRKNA